MQKFLRLAPLILACLAFVTGIAQASDDSENLPTLEGEMSAWIDRELEARKIPGAGFALVQGDRLIQAKGFGFADLEAGKLATAETVFRVGSVSKPVTATALLRLVETTSLDLDTDLHPLLEDLPISPPLEKPLTPHHLLTHTCGFNERLFGQHARTPTDFQSLGDYLKDYLPPRFTEPGSIISYNDYCTSLAGYAVEQVSGKTFHDYVRENVFSPLGMSASTLDQLVDERSFPAGLAKSYRWHKGVHEAYARDYIMTTPAAGLYTSAQDMGIYLMHLISNEGTKVLSPEGLALQKSVQFTHHENLPGRAYGFASMRFRGHEVFYKDGQAMGFSARLVMVPETGDGFFIVQNRSIFGTMGAINDAGRLARELTMVFLEHLFPPSTSSPERTPPTPRDRDMSNYVGIYRNVVAARHTFEKLITLTDEITIESPAPGVINFGSQKYVEVEDGLFQWHEGGPFYLAFGSEGEGKSDYFFIGGGAYERTSLLSSAKWAPRIIAGLLATAFLVLLASSILALRQRPSRPVARKLMASSSLKIIGVTGIAATFYFIDLQEFFFGPPLVLGLFLALPLLAFSLDAWLIVVSPAILRASSAVFQGVVLLHILTALGLLWWLNDWNLLGWQYD